MVRRHYENFPVASWFLPKHIRRPIAAIYAFARSADDMADEGHASAEQRMAQLGDYGRQLAARQQSSDPVFIALEHAMQQHDLPESLFHALLTAFKMDLTQKRYANFDELLHYCQHSANPIGRLLVYLNNRVTDKNLQNSDAICTALQLINFYQDLHQDYHENDRIYIPQDEMQNYRVTEQHFKSLDSGMAMQSLMQFQVQRARDLLLSGRQLGTILPGRMGFELRMVIAGGLQICEKLLINRNVFARPRLTIFDWLKMFSQASLYK
jgi:squalene synthase HpnC